MKIYSILYKLFAVIVSIPILWFLIIGIVGKSYAQIVISVVLILGIWIGAIFAGKKRKKYFITSVFVAAVISLSLLYRLVKRVLFVLENDGMEGPGGFGSPMAFLLHGFVELFFFLPFFTIFVVGLVLSIKGKIEGA